MADTRRSRTFVKGRTNDARGLMHSQMSTPFPFGSHTPHCVWRAQYMLSSQMRVASLTRPGMVNVRGGGYGYMFGWTDEG